MPLTRPVLDDRSFDALLERTRDDLLAHELTHVVQQMSASTAGRRLLKEKLAAGDPDLRSALTSPGALDRSTARRLARALGSRS